MTSKNITNFDPTIDFIKTHLKITDLYNFVKGQKNPRDKHKFVCPFCHSGERGDAAFHFYDDSNTYKCYACDRQGDIIAFYHNKKILVKRVIGVSGDTVDIGTDGRVTVNGTALNEPYAALSAEGECDITLPFTVPSGRYFT